MGSIVLNSNEKIILHIGIDDTDSNEGMCTTYLTHIIIEQLKEHNIYPDDLPRLIRLNPFARYKTRGNGALSFRVTLNSRSQVELVENIVLENVEKYSMFEGVNTNPGVIFYEGEITDEMREYAVNAIYSIYTISYAENFAKKIGARVHKFKKGRGIIGAIASISIDLPDETFECLAYRTPENIGTKRKLNQDSIYEMNEKTYPETFDNIDIEGNYTAIEPHTPCPVLYGIRGNTPEIVEQAHKMVESYEEIEGYCIFRTNQHTDMHIQEGVNISDMNINSCYKIQCKVTKNPHDIEGGHVFFEVSDDTGILECAAFEPTKTFRNIIRKLRVGDELILYGGLNENKTFNIEKFKLISLAPQYNILNPVCSCGKRMKSAGKNKGYKCPKCGNKTSSEDKIKELIPRDITEGFYEVPTEARRHLSKPIVRMK